MAENNIKRTTTIEKIKKLLALASNNPSVTEAAAAALKAQKLIADFDVKDYELHDVQSKEVIEAISCNINRNPWAVSLAFAIADNFRCHIYRSKHNELDGWKAVEVTEIVFVGYDLDANAAQVTFDKLYEIGRDLATKEVRIAKKKYGTTSGVRNSFLLGFVNGIQKELERQCHELMLVRSKEVDKAYEDITSGYGRHHSHVTTHDGAASRKARSNGYEAGRNAVRGSRMGGRLGLTA